VHQNKAVLKYTNYLKHKIYRYIMPKACDFLNGWWRNSPSLIVHHDSHFVYRFVWFKCIFDAFLNASNIILKDIGLWVRIGSLKLWLALLTYLYCITTFSQVCFWSLRLWTGGSLSWTIFRSMEITGTATTNITVCRMSFLLLILSTFFDDNKVEPCADAKN